VKFDVGTVVNMKTGTFRNVKSCIRLDTYITKDGTSVEIYKKERILCDPPPDVFRFLVFAAHPVYLSFSCHVNSIRKGIFEVPIPSGGAV
jgi:hypothetical protein